MRAYPEAYRNEVVETQGKLFDFFSSAYPSCDAEDFILSYMNSRTRKAIDEGQAYVATMDCKDLWSYFVKTEGYAPKKGSALKGFMPEWIGEFYAYYQWYYGLSSSELAKKVPLSFLKKAYAGLHNLDLELAVKKVGRTH